ncbi:hypothetical protein EDB80DRAFT_676607 [Ilyonectria destructans]|nr:hypothetical protein EDB80DRAFT_676607 [Ilyonectria destructans]
MPPFTENEMVPYDRFSYLPNPDWRGLLPLVLTASSQQATILNNFLQKHFTARCSIQASFSASGQTFSIEFHLPFFVWKTAKTVARDKRISSDNSALRKSRPLSFLKESRSSAEEEDDTIDCLYESQWSCVVTGLNDTVWNVYSFTDTYFYDANDQFDRSSIKYYKRWTNCLLRTRRSQGLDSLYGRMIEYIYNSEDAGSCKDVLAITSVVYRPVTLDELKVLAESLEGLD